MYIEYFNFWEVFPIVAIMLVLGIVVVVLMAKEGNKEWRKKHSETKVIETIEQLGAYQCPECKRIISIYDINWKKNPVKTQRMNYYVETSFCPHCGQKLINKVVKTFWV